MKLGFVGTGVIAAAVIEGLIRAWGDAHEIVVSPRSEATSRDLAARHACVRRAASNAEATQGADIVFLACLPAQMREVVPTLPFRDGQIAASFIAGARVEDVAALIGAKARVCRMIPLPMAARLSGPIVLQPPIAQLRGLFEPVGTLIAVEDDAQAAALGAGSAQMSAFLKLTLTSIACLEERGVPRETARDYAASLFGALSETVALTPPDALDGLIPAHETPGGINEACRLRLEALGWFDAFRAGLDAADAQAARLTE